MIAVFCALASASAMCGCSEIKVSRPEGATSLVEQTTDTTDITETTDTYETAAHHDTAESYTADAAADVTSDAETMSATDTTTEAASTEAADSSEAITDDPVATEPLSLCAEELYGYSIGRTLIKDDVLYMNHSCSGLRFDFSGTSLTATFVSSAKYCYDSIHRAWIAVYLDDSTEPYKRFPLDCEKAAYRLFESDTPIDARITVVKLTEQQFGTAGITLLETGSGDRISTVAPSDRYIEFFGDSITAGYGNEGELSHGFDTTEENGYLTYAPIAARELGADYSMVCVSGMGLTDSRTCDYVAADIYPKTDVFISDEGYSFTRRPQLIVVNLGANDSYYINKDQSYYELFESRYYELLTQIRSNNPDAVILCCICDYWEARMPQIERVVSSFCSDTGDTKIHTLLLPYVRNDADYGSDAHPKISVQYEIADVLLEKIDELDIF